MTDVTGLNRSGSLNELCPGPLGGAEAPPAPDGLTENVFTHDEFVQM
jgi:hypothetical protein